MSRALVHTINSPLLLRKIDVAHCHQGAEPGEGGEVSRNGITVRGLHHATPDPPILASGACRQGIIDVWNGRRLTRP